MRLQKAKESDYAKIRAFYDAVIDGTEGMEEHAKWKKGSHPFDDVIEDYIKNGDMYMCMEEEQFVGIMAVPFYQTEEYQEIEWNILASEHEVVTLHIFAIAPEFQGKGYGKKAVNLAIDMARENGMKAFRLDTLGCNIPAQKMYESIGFELRGKQKLYTDNAGVIEFLYYEKSVKKEEQKK